MNICMGNFESRWSKRYSWKNLFQFFFEITLDVNPSWKSLWDTLIRKLIFSENYKPTHNVSKTWTSSWMFFIDLITFFITVVLIVLFQSPLLSATFLICRKFYFLCLPNGYQHGESRFSNVKNTDFWSS